ncbi:MAG: tyrosine-type recombinase/integrase [Anaerolineae bacterium]|nr:tyrosine-type recombinase/integrase [Anaerolineae bacterium]
MVERLAAAGGEIALAGAWLPAVVWLGGANTLATRQTYLKALREFARKAGSGPAEVTVAHVAAWKAELVSAGLSPRTVRLRLSVVRSFFEWCIGQGLHPGPNPAGGVPLPRVGRELTGRALTRRQVAVLAGAALNRRDSVLVWLLATGLRAAEAIFLEQRDVHFEGDGLRLVVRGGKGGHSRQVLAGPEAAEALLRYIQAGRRLVAVRAPLLQALDGSGRRLSYGNVYRIVRSCAVRAGLGHLAPHDLRRTYITEQLDLGVALPVVQRAAGHALMEQTARYYRPRP